MLVKIGDGIATKCPTAHLHGLAGALFTDVTKFWNIIVETLISCVASFPTKTGIYATLVGLLNVKLQERKESETVNDETSIENKDVAETEEGTTETNDGRCSTITCYII